MKVGLQFYVAHGAAGANALAEAHGASVFLDLKFHDIPNTVAGAVRSAAAAAPAMLTVHAAGGAAMMRAAADAAKRIADHDGERPKVLAVTVLTSFDESDADAAGMAGRIGDIVRRAAALAQECGLDGVVASARETAALRAEHDPDFILVAPGVRPGWAPADGKKRVVRGRLLRMKSPPAQTLANTKLYVARGGHGRKNSPLIQVPADGKKRVVKRGLWRVKPPPAQTLANTKLYVARGGRGRRQFLLVQTPADGKKRAVKRGLWKAKPPPAQVPADDQKRVATPAEAIRRGADYLVIGRPIVRAADPAAAARRIAAEMAGPP